MLWLRPTRFEGVDWGLTTFVKLQMISLVAFEVFCFFVGAGSAGSVLDSRVCYAVASISLLVSVGVQVAHTGMRHWTRCAAICSRHAPLVAIHAISLTGWVIFSLHMGLGSAGLNGRVSYAIAMAGLYVCAGLQSAFAPTRLYAWVCGLAALIAFVFFLRFTGGA